MPAFADSLTALFRLSSGRSSAGWPSLFEWQEAQAATYRLAPRSLSIMPTFCDRLMPAAITEAASTGGATLSCGLASSAK